MSNPHCPLPPRSAEEASMLSREQYDEASRLQIFSGCRPETVAMLLEGAFLQKFPERIDLAKEGDRPDFLHVVVSGAIELYARYRDRETTVEVIGPPNSFIAAAVVLDRPHLKSARVIEPARILMLPAASVRKALPEDAAFAARIAVELATAYRAVTRDLKNQKLRTGLERLANWLARRDQETGATHRIYHSVRQESAGGPTRHGARKPVAKFRHAGPFRRQGQRSPGRDRRPRRSGATRQTRPADRRSVVLTNGARRRGKAFRLCGATTFSSPQRFIQAATEKACDGSPSQRGV